MKYIVVIIIILFIVNIGRILSKKEVKENDKETL